MITQILAGVEKNLGSFTVRRSLPATTCKSIGPFVFFDHVGPATFANGEGIDVRPHPHLGLATVTYLFEGVFLHRDSLGTVQEVTPGAVNWMIAGRGIVHSERTPTDQRVAGSRLHGVQIWLALPQNREAMLPEFSHHPAHTLPQLDEAGASLTVIAGEAYGLRSPVPVLSPTLYVDVILRPGTQLQVPADYAERAVYVIAGSICAGDKILPPGSMALLAPGQDVLLHTEHSAHLMLLGGSPLDGSRTVWWNFVASNRARIQEASRQWHEADERIFGQIPGETERIPLPQDAQQALLKAAGNDDVVSYP